MIMTTIKTLINGKEQDLSIPTGYRVCIRGEIIRGGDKYFSSMDNRWIATAMFN